MKKLLGILTICALASSVFAQGTVALQNKNTGFIKAWTSPTDSTAVNLPVGAGYVQLIAAPSGTAFANSLGAYSSLGFTAAYPTLSGFLTANPGWAAVPGSAVAPTSIAGLFNGGGVTIANVTGGANANYFLIGWTGATTYDASYALALAGTATFGGISAIATTGTGNPNASPVGTPVNLNSTFTGMTLAPFVIPEPTSLALAGLGLAALLAFRRRN